MEEVGVLVAEVVRVVQTYGDGTEGWQVRDGVEAWDMLQSEFTSEEVQAVMRDGGFDLYQDFVQHWPEYGPFSLVFNG